MYRTFVRTWWRKNPKYPDGKEPYPGRKTYMDVYNKMEDAQNACRDYNRRLPLNNPLSKKMEFDEF